MKRNLTVIVIIIIGGFKLQAQFLDSLHQLFNSSSSIDARFESRWSFIRNEAITVTGVRLGVAYNRKLRIGGGLSWLQTNRSEIFNQTNTLGNTEDVKKYLKFGYLCYYIDFVYYRTKRWQLSVPIQLGTGMSWFQKESNYHTHVTDKKYFLLLYEPGITIQFKIFRWLGVGGDYAFRFVMRNQKKIGEQLNSPTLTIKYLFWPDQLFYELAPKNKLTKLYGPAEW